MKLSEALNKYIVVPSSYAAVVGYTSPDADGDMQIEWYDDDELFTVVCKDQDITVLDQNASEGAFGIRDIEGNFAMFIAMKEVRLEG